MHAWISDLKLKVMKWVRDPTHAVDWLKQVENANNKWEDFGRSGRLYNPQYLILENQIQDALMKIIQGEFRRQIVSVQDQWLHKSPVEAITGRLILKKLYDLN